MDWELSKENFQPLKRGRDPVVLDEATTSPSADKERREEQRRSVGAAVWVGLAKGTQAKLISKSLGLWGASGFEVTSEHCMHNSTVNNALCKCRGFCQEISQYKGEDPLEPWIRYVQDLLIPVCCH